MKYYSNLSKGYIDIAHKKVCPLCGGNLQGNVHYLTDGGEICGKCFAEYGKRNGHITESEFYALLAKEENNGN